LLFGPDFIDVFSLFYHIDPPNIPVCIQSEPCEGEKLRQERFDSSGGTGNF
jgi:hypothetical protein